MKKIVLFSFLILLSCCKRKEIKLTQNKTYRDSTLLILNFDANTKRNVLDEEKAELILNKHFKKKGFLIESELNFETFNPELKENLGKKAIDFLEIKPLNNSATIVKYYNCEPFENGNCVQPHYSIIANKMKGYEIINEDFLPNNFTIDSVKNEKGKPYIYGYYFECANKKKLKSYRIAVK